MEGTMKSYLRDPKRLFCILAITVILLGLVPVPVLSSIGTAYAQEEGTPEETPEPPAEEGAAEEPPSPPAEEEPAAEGE